MLELRQSSYQSAKLIFERPDLRTLKEELCEVLRHTTVPPDDPVQAMLREIGVALRCRGWTDLGRGGGDEVLDRFGIRMPGQFRKDRVQVNIEFAVENDWHSAIFDLQYFFSQQMVDACGVVVPTKRFVASLPRNIACYELVSTELRWAKRFISAPILVVGLEPTDHEPMPASEEQAV